MAVGEPMRPVDAFSWRMERDPALRSTIVALLWLDRSPSWEPLVERLDRLSRVMPGLRQRVVESPWPGGTPRWLYEPDFDLRWHLRRLSLPRPADTEAVLEIARQSAMDTFDRERPLWEATVIEDVDGPGVARAAALLKLHHSLTDGVGAMRMLSVLVDPDRQPAELEPMPDAPDGESLDLRALARQSVTGLTSGATRWGWRSARTAPRLLGRTLRRPVRSVRAAAEVAGSVQRTGSVISETMSPLMNGRGTTRHLAMLDVSLDALDAASRSAGASVNDAFLAALTGGLRRYHERHGRVPEVLRANMPINQRRGDDLGWGNRINLQRVVLPVAEPDPVRRLRMIHATVVRTRHEPSLPLTDRIAVVLNLFPARYIGGMLKHIDFVASDLAGSPEPVYLAGGEVTGFFVFGPTIGAAFNATMVSHVGTCHIGVNIDAAAVPEPETLVRCLEEGIAEVIR